ncbi:hypothetical protein KPH14_008896 [Odynerus spinipes]|uniref:Uncharacterized protein n=1 Tax=Odynerus spinipes TaxID=1348599 RepID=A0AAD9RN75_9HYME|nr:hypothetical protein KPH14_008896 [Odynerus spinipes]
MPIRWYKANGTDSEAIKTEVSAPRRITVPTVTDGPKAVLGFVRGKQNIPSRSQTGPGHYAEIGGPWDRRYLSCQENQ